MLYFFSGTRPGRTRGWIFHELWLIRRVFAQGQSFWGLRQYRNSFGGNILQNSSKWGVNRQFQGKRVEYKNRDILLSINTISVQFQEDVKTIKHKSWVVRYDVMKNPRWRPSAILKIKNKCSELGNRN